MTQSQRTAEKSPFNSRSSRVKLGWLVLLLFVTATVYLYCNYSSLIPKTIYGHSSGDASRPIAGTPNSLTAIASHMDEAAEASELLLDSTPSGEDRHSLNVEYYSAVNEREPLAFEDANEIVDDSMTEPEGDGNSTSYSDGLEDNYNFTTGEFGIVFADQEPTDDADTDGSELITDNHGEHLWKVVDEGHDSLNSVSSEPTQVSVSTRIIKVTSEMGHTPSTPPTSAPRKKAHFLFTYMQRNANVSNPHCAMETKFHSWEKGMVTQLGIPLKRDCHKLRTNPQGEVKSSKLHSQVTAWKNSQSWKTFALEYKHKDCDYIRQEFENNFYVSEVEKDFPIAYILVVYTNAGQVIRLLKSIYRPHNLYCIHPDARQGEVFASFFRAIAKCLDNVFIVSKPVRVYYGHISITDSQLHCMRDLMTYPATRWKYVINLSGREVPLKTNREIVESLKKLKGYTGLNIGNLTPYFWRARFRFKFRLGKNGRMWQTHQRQSRPPPGIKLYKSLTFLAASRAFVDFLLNNALSVKFLRFLGTVYAPEEHFYSSLYALPQAKGARPPKGVVKYSDMPIVNEVMWTTGWKRKRLNFYCPGRRIMHGICILTASDLGWIEKMGIHSTQPVFFFNKYFLEWDPIPMDCMEEQLVTTNIDEYWHDCIPSHTV